MEEWEGNLKKLLGKKRENTDTKRSNTLSYIGSNVSKLSNLWDTYISKAVQRQGN